MASSPELTHVLGVWERMKGNSPIYDFLLSTIQIVSASQGIISARLVVGENHVNSRGTIHGAVSSALVDWSGGLAIVSHGLEKSGASIDIHINYIGTAVIGDVLEIEAITNKVGRSVAFTTIRIVKLVGEEKKMVATASHTKYLS